MTRSLTGDWIRDLPHSKPALYHQAIDEAVNVIVWKDIVTWCSQGKTRIMTRIATGTVLSITSEHGGTSHDSNLNSTVTTVTDKVWTGVPGLVTSNRWWCQRWKQDVHNNYCSAYYPPRNGYFIYSVFKCSYGLMSVMMYLCIQYNCR